MYTPTIPLSGYSGWSFLEKTYSRQLETYTSSSEVQNDVAYLQEKLSQPISVDDFLSDTRLMRITLTSFDLSGEEWKGGFIRKVLEEVTDEDSTFLDRLNNSKYTNFAESLSPVDDMISLTSDQLSEMVTNFQTISFETAVGEVDENMRLSLNYQSEIGNLVGEDSSDEAILYKLLGDEPVYTVLQSALGIPEDISNLDIDDQARILKERITSTFGISDMSDLSSAEVIDKVLQRFHVMEEIENGSTSYSPASNALSILSSGVGSEASQNLFLSIMYS